MLINAASDAAIDLDRDRFSATTQRRSVAAIGDVTRGRERFAERSVARARLRSHTEVDRLIDAAWRVLGRNGWWGLKVDSVLREAGLSTRCFYRHFANKNELLLALLEDEAARAAVRIERLVAAQPDPTAQLAAWISAVVGFAHHEKTARRTRLFATHWPEIEAEFPEETRRCLLDFLVPLERVLQEGQRRGVFRDVAPQACALAIYHMSSGATRDLRGGGWMTRTQEEHVVTDLALRALTAQAG